MSSNLTTHEMIYEAVQSLTADDPDRIMTRNDIIDWIYKKYGETKKKSAIRSRIMGESVNSPSRVYYDNPRPRIVNTPSPRDLLYSLGGGNVVKYDPQKHGIWEIRQDEQTNSLFVVKVGEAPSKEPTASSAFALESHLRDYIAKHLGTLQIQGKKLELVKTEYQTGVGRVDILAKDPEGNFYVFELKCSRGCDKALGQILRYIGWIKAREADGKKVFGIIVAEKIDEELKFAVQAVENIDLFEYEVKFQLKTPSETKP